MNNLKKEIHLANISDLDELIKTATREEGFVDFSKVQELLTGLDPVTQEEVIKDSNIIADALWAADVPKDSIKLIESAIRDMLSTIVTDTIKPLETDEDNI